MPELRFHAFQLRIFPDLRHQQVEVAAVYSRQFSVQGFYTVGTALRPFRPQFLHRVFVGDYTVVADEVVRMCHDLLLDRTGHVIPGRKTQFHHVGIVETCPGMLPDYIGETAGEPVVLDYPRTYGGVHDGMVLGTADIVKEGAGHHQIHVRLRDALGDLLGDGPDGSTVDDHPLLTPCIPKKCDALLVRGDPVSRLS